jgi:hypothetical protein
MNRNLGGTISRVARHQVPSKARIDIDESSDWLSRPRLAVDPRPCGVMNTQDVDFLLCVNIMAQVRVRRDVDLHRHSTKSSRSPPQMV